MSILIIGGTRFIGPHVVRQLLQAGKDVTIYHRGEHEPDLPAEVHHVHSADAGIPMVRFPPDLIRPWDVVIHMMPIGEADMRAFAEAFAARVGRAVIISSGDVYLAYGRLQGIEPGSPVRVPLAEDAPRRSVLYPYRRMAKSPDEWTYNYEKILVEDIALQQDRLNAVVLRLPKVYGPGDGGHLSMLAGIAEKHPDWRWTHGYVEDVAHAIVLAALKPEAAGTYNVGEAETLSAAQRLDGWNVRPSKEGPASHLVKDFDFAQDIVYDTGRVRRELGYRERVPYEEGMGRTLAATRSPAS
jgi:nucleoside-diphosphate-sugar epimerase